MVSRVVLRNGPLGDEVHLQDIYPPPQPNLNLDYFLQMMQRERIVLRMVSAYIQRTIYLIRSAGRRRQFAPNRSRMEKRLKTPAFAVYHFLENFQVELLRHIRKGRNSSEILSDPESVGIEIQTRIVNGYPDDILLPAFQFYRIMVSTYRQKPRPPTYAGTIERKIRGWDRTPASDAEVAQVLIYGGMEEVLKIMLNPTYGARLH